MRSGQLPPSVCDASVGAISSERKRGFAINGELSIQISFYSLTAALSGVAKANMERRSETLVIFFLFRFASSIFFRWNEKKVVLHMEITSKVCFRSFVAATVDRRRLRRAGAEGD